MSKNAKEHRNASGHAAYKASLRKLQIELVKVQRHVIKHGHKVLVIFEGRDSSGKDGTINRPVSRRSSGRLAPARCTVRLDESLGTFSGLFETTFHHALR